jgi:hypothetical protein
MLPTSWRRLNLPLFSVAIASIVGGCEVLNMVAQDVDKGGDETAAAKLPDAVKQLGELAKSTEVGELGARDFKREKDGSLLYVDPKGQFRAHVNSEGKVEFSEIAAALPQKNEAVVGVHNEATILRFAGPAEAIERLRGQPHATEKLAFLRRSERFRAGLAVKAAGEQTDRALDHFDEHIRAVWNDESRSLAQRHAVLFALWDECEEAPIGAAEAQLTPAQRAGEAARKRIEDFIRRHAASGSPQAISSAQLAQFNGRRVSKREFSPYAAK